MKYLKHFEVANDIEDERDDWTKTNIFLLCVNDDIQLSGMRLTLGQKYQLIQKDSGEAFINDDANSLRFINKIGDKDYIRQDHSNTTILTTDNTLGDYYKRATEQRFDL